MGQRSESSSASRLNECSNKEHSSEDLISQLPDDVLVLIVSFLTLKEAAKTSVVSSRWKTLWMHTPLLHFDATKAIVGRISHRKKLLKTERCRFVNWVNRVLQLHQGQTLDEFRVYFDLDKTFQNEIDKWLEYALARRVQKLELNLLLKGRLIAHEKYCCVFPDQLLNPSNWMSSRLPDSGYYGIHLPGFLDFKSLTAFSLKGIGVTGEIIEFFLLNCPFLERLEVVGSGQLVNLVVSGPSLKLKYLEISHCVNVESIVISHTNIISLKLSKTRNVTLKHLPMLTEVGMRGILDHFPGDIFSLFSFCLSQLEVLELCIYQPEETMDLSYLPELRKLKQLVMIVFATADKSLIGLASFMKAFPNLQRCVLELRLFSAKNERKLEEPVSKCPFPCLKVIEVPEYSGDSAQDELIMYLVENAIELEKIIIDPRRPHSSYKRAALEKAARCHAVQQYVGLVPQHIELVIL